MANVPTPQKPILCKQFSEGKSTRKPCADAHGWKELEEVALASLRSSNGADLKWKTALCSQFQKDKCKRGWNCNFAHGELDLRATSQRAPNATVVRRQEEIPAHPLGPSLEPETASVLLRAIEFTQKTCAPNFRDGKPLQQTIDELKNRHLETSELPPIRVVQQGWLLFSLDNRRLLCMKTAFPEAEYPDKKITVLKVSLSNLKIQREWESKYEGKKKIGVRQGCNNRSLSTPTSRPGVASCSRGQRAGGKEPLADGDVASGGTASRTVTVASDSPLTLVRTDSELASASSPAEGPFLCALCSVTCSSISNLHAHQCGKRHAQKEMSLSFGAARQKRSASVTGHDRKAIVPQTHQTENLWRSESSGMMPGRMPSNAGADGASGSNAFLPSTPTSRPGVASCSRGQRAGGKEPLADGDVASGGTASRTVTVASDSPLTLARTNSEVASPSSPAEGPFLSALCSVTCSSTSQLHAQQCGKQHAQKKMSLSSGAARQKRSASVTGHDRKAIVPQTQQTENLWRSESSGMMPGRMPSRAGVDGASGSIRKEPNPKSELFEILHKNLKRHQFLPPERDLNQRRVELRLQQGCGPEPIVIRAEPFSRKIDAEKEASRQALLKLS